MPSPVLLGVLALFAVYSINYYRGFARNLAAAKQSGLPYIIVPIYAFNIFWLITHKLWLPFFHKLPTSWTSPWLQFLSPEWIWAAKFEPFKEIGSDIFIIVTPNLNTCIVANAEAVTQIVNRRNDFPKPIHIYKSVDLYGKNVVSTEGATWRHHRKVTAPPFTEASNHLVWLESLHQGQSMMTGWVGEQGERAKTTTISDVASATMRLSLHVISRAGFGQRLLWPHEEIQQQGRAGAVPEGHTMTFKDALSTLLENLIVVMLLPRWILARAPFKATKIGYQSYVEWGQYMREMYAAKKAEVTAGERREGLDLMGALVNGAGITADSPRSKDAEKAFPSKTLLTDDEILGNAFVFILAGHETAANSIHFSILYLALKWSTQARLHRDLDAIFGTRPVSDWDYERDVPKLFGSMAGAILNEELRLIPPVTGIPKCTLKNSPQPLTLAGKRITIPQNCAITLNTVATHRNPALWPTLCSPTASASEIAKDLDSFAPERWLLDTQSTHHHHVSAPAPETQEVDEDIGGPSPATRDTSPSLHHPPRGAYIPFSDGARACLGRRFAQVEVLAVLAVIFRDYSVELAVDDFASEELVESMRDDEAARRRVWEKARDRAEGLLDRNMGTVITIQLRGASVPVRFVRRGEERFMFD